jgi:hypothetical protein
MMPWDARKSGCGGPRRIEAKALVCRLFFDHLTEVRKIQQPFREIARGGEALIVAA